MTIAERVAQVRSRIADACRAAGRSPASVRLVAASKQQPPAAIREALAAGQRLFGENYARELREKREALSDCAPDLEWHFIGRVQTSNAKDIARATLVHGVGSLEQARALGKRAGAEPVPVLLQLSLWEEESKNGFTDGGIERNWDALREIGGLVVRGFMALPPAAVEPRRAFADVRALRDRVAPQLAELSMGMSADLDDAILEGATIVRVGTAIFGPRPAREERS